MTGAWLPRETALQRQCAQGRVQVPGARRVLSQGSHTPCLFLQGPRVAGHPALSPRGTRLSFAVQRLCWASVTET